MSWPNRSLAEVAPIRSRKPEFFDGARRYYSTGAVGKSGELDSPELVTFAERPSRANSMPRIGDVGFARMNGTQKVVLISEAELGSLFSTGFCFLEPNDAIDSKYLFYFLTSEGFQSEKNALAGEGIMGGIKNSDVANMQIPLPPLPEQQRIVRLLDEAFEGIAIAKANAEKNLQSARLIFENYLQTVFQQAGVESVTAAIDDERHITQLQRLCDNYKQDIVDGPFGSNLKREDYVSEGVPVLKIQNLKPLRIELKKMDYVSPDKFRDLQRHSFSRGDIIMTKLGDPLGVSAIVNHLEEGVIVADLVRIRAAKINTKFLCYQLNSPVVKRFINAKQKGTTRPRVTLSVVRELPIYSPPLAEQIRIVTKLDQLLLSVESLIASYAKKKTALDELKISLLNKVFSGYLDAA